MILTGSMFDLLWHERTDKSPIEIEVASTEGWTIAMELKADSTEQIYVRPTAAADKDVLRATSLSPVFAVDLAAHQAAPKAQTAVLARVGGIVIGDMQIEIRFVLDFE